MPPKASAKTAKTAATRGRASKRAAPPAAAAAPQRQSKRIKATPTKSSYFEDPDSVDESGRHSSPSRAESLHQPSDLDVVSSEKEEEEEEEDDEQQQQHIVTTKRKARPRKQSAIPQHGKPAQEQELWREGATLPSDTQVIIKKPTARDAGSTLYTDESIHPNTLLFLRDLAANNDRKWFKMHDPDYRASLQDFTSFLECLTPKIIEADETIPELPVKDIIMRIYRDIRFSKNKTPYKTAFAAAWSRTGRKGPYAAYYLQVKPNGGSYVGGGLWCPPTEPLNRLRRDIDRKPHKIKAILTDARLRKEFFGGIGRNEIEAVQAFVSQPENASTALKSKPKGYDNTHENIDLLRLKSFTIGKPLGDHEVIGEGGLERITELMSCLVPFITYLNSVVMPDEDSSDSSEDDEGEDED